MNLERRTVVKLTGLASGTGAIAGVASGTESSTAERSTSWERGRSDGISVTVLGSGASSFENGRANAGHVVHVDGEPTFLLDAGGGVGARLGEAGVDLTALDGVFLGHLHIDHTAALPAVVKAAYQRGRDRPLPVYGPTGTDDVPGTAAFLSRLFDPETGAYNYLEPFVERYTDGKLELEPTEIDATVGEDDGIACVRDEDVTVEAIPQTHGAIPALAYRFTCRGRSITFSGDTSLVTDNLRRLADGTDVLVHNRVVDAHVDPDEPKTDLHAYAAEIGATASAADVRTLVLSHLSQTDETEIEREMELIAREYDGPIVAVRDLVEVDPDGRIGAVEPIENDVLVCE
ncbi:MBL fold metallo-hydrolase [Natronococcus jeotgali]|nr:MBL fold metallo-hydrolase [Natronococcus jeotgali]